MTSTTSRSFGEWFLLICVAIAALVVVILKG